VATSPATPREGVVNREKEIDLEVEFDCKEEIEQEEVDIEKAYDPEE